MALENTPDLIEYLQQYPGPFTFFAPTESAFVTLPPEFYDALFDPANADAVQELLLNHIVEGMAIDLSNPSNVPMEVTTVGGQTLTITFNDNGLARVNSIPILQPNIKAQNGFIHGIPFLLIPDGLEFPPPSPGDTNIIVLEEMEEGSVPMDETTPLGRRRFRQQTTKSVLTTEIMAAKCSICTPNENSEYDDVDDADDSEQFVANHDTIIATPIAGWPDITCGQLQQFGLQGLIPVQQCILLQQGFISQICGCSTDERTPGEESSMTQTSDVTTEKEKMGAAAMNAPVVSQHHTHENKMDSSSLVNVTVKIIFDDDPDDIGWFIDNVGEGYVAESRPVGYYHPSSSMDQMEEIILLPPGMYMFFIEDIAEDGFGPDGSLTLSVEGIDIASIEGNFGKTEFISFTIP